jgi:hypothetical protein
MNRTVLVIGIIFLLIGASVVSSTGTIVEDTHIDYHSMDSIDVSKEELSSDKIAYGSDIFSPYNLVKFPLDDPSNIEIIAHGQNQYWLTGGTWSYEHGWFACEYNSGGLWLIDPETGFMENIGGGGTSSGDLAWDDWTSELYSATGMQGLAFNSEGICYGIYGYESNYYLYIVDFDPYEQTLIGPLINFTSEWLYPLDAEFDKDTDILYILSTEGLTAGLYTCDTETCECTFIGNTGGLKLTAFAIPYEDDPPVTNIYFDPPDPDGENGWYVTPVTVTLEAKDDMNEVNTTYYSINSEPWVIYESPFVLSEDEDDILIEYYSVDTSGNIELKKSAWLDIDKTPPTIDLTYEVTGGNPIEGWRFIFTATATDVISGMERVEFFFNNELLETVYGLGPTYEWEWIIYAGNNVVRVVGYDIAGNSAFDEIGCRNRDIVLNQLIHPLLERFPLLQRLLDVWRSFTI